MPVLCCQGVGVSNELKRIYPEYEHGGVACRSTAPEQAAGAAATQRGCADDNEEAKATALQESRIKRREEQ